tara:strand:+ start:2264 stop:2881 length:618 start_codon:yes stop_codon:yes gene_type:complete
MINKIKLIKILIISWLITFGFQSLTKANDVKDFEIEGMNVGSSLLDYFSKKKINASIVDWYDDLEKNRYVAFAFDSPDFETYDFVDVWTKHGDNKYLIDTIAGVVYFGEDKPIKDVENCYQEQKIIADDLLKIFSSAKKTGPSTLYHSGDPSGKSSYTDIYLRLDNDYEVLVSCYDWSEEALKKENKHDHMYISIRSLELDAWLN